MEQNNLSNNRNRSISNESDSSDALIKDMKTIASQQKHQMELIQSSANSNLILNENIQSLNDLNHIRNKALSEIVSVNKASNLTLKSIAEPNIADWISASSNIILALLGVYAAIKVKSVFEERLDNKVYAEIEKFWEYSDDIIQEINSYFLFFPFKLSEPVEEWNENNEVKSKVEKFLNFSEKQSDKMKNFLHVISGLERNLNRLGWQIHPKALNCVNDLYKSLEHIYRSFGEYNCLTAQLFRIDRQYIGMTMFMGVENMEWEQRFALVDRNLPSHIRSIDELKDKILSHIESLENFSAKKKFVSKR